MNNGWASKGGIIPGPPQRVRLKDGERVWAKEGDQLIEYIHEVDIFGEQWRLRKTGRTTKRKRKPIVAIRKDPDSPYYPWIWSCQICPGEPDLGKNFDKCVDWQSALIQATHCGGR